MNIGCVAYSKNFTTGELTATWSFDDGTNVMNGTGHATGTQSKNYIGKYKITYFDDKKNTVGEFDLIIKEENNSYILKWYNDQTLQFTGIALLIDSMLIGGWKPV